MTLVHNTGSAELNRILVERDRIHAVLWRRPIPRVPFSLQREKTVKERIAEAMKMRGQISEGRLHSILNAIHGSARDLRESSPKIVSPTIKHIQTVVAKHFNLTLVDMLSRNRAPRIARPRQIAMYFSRLLTSNALEFIGIRFGQRCHKIVCYSSQKIERLIATDAVFAEEIETLRRMLTP